MTPARILTVLLATIWLAFVLYITVRIIGGGMK